MLKKKGGYFLFFHLYVDIPQPLRAGLSVSNDDYPQRADDPQEISSA
jgi:hypothetical protein